MESIQIGYEIGRLEEEVSALEEEVKILQTVKSALLSLGRVEKIAKEKLKLVSPKEEQLIYEDSSPLL